MRTRLFVLAGFALAFWPVSATARPEDRAAADALFQAARAEFDRGEFASACEKFAESHRLDPAPGTLLNLSLCLEKVGKVATAWQGYRQVAEQLRDERLDFASKRSSELEARLPWITLRLATNAPEGTRVFRDGVEIRSAAFGVALPIDPGPHTLVVKAPGRLDATGQFDVEERQRIEIVAHVGLARLEPRKKAVLKPTTTPSPTPTDGTNNTFAWISGCVGVAGITTSLVTGALAMSARSTVRDHCVDRLCDAEGLDAASAGGIYSTVSTVSGVVGFGGLGISTYLFLTQKEEVQPPTTYIKAATLPGGGYFGMTQRF